MKKIIFFFVAWTIFLFVVQNIDHKIRKYSQHHEKVYEAVMAVDLVNFFQNAGGAFGYQNYFK